MHKGQRVQAHPATDAWMMGDRFGTVTGLTRANLHDTHVKGVLVLMDRSERVRMFHPDNLIEVS